MVLSNKKLLIEQFDTFIVLIYHLDLLYSKKKFCIILVAGENNSHPQHLFVWFQNIDEFPLAIIMFFAKDVQILMHSQIKIVHEAALNGTKTSQGYPTRFGLSPE